jgi:hypothetical protein
MGGEESEVRGENSIIGASPFSERKKVVPKN